MFSDIILQITTSPLGENIIPQILSVLINPRPKVIISNHGYNCHWDKLLTIYTIYASHQFGYFQQNLPWSPHLQGKQTQLVQTFLRTETFHTMQQINQFIQQINLFSTIYQLP